MRTGLKMIGFLTYGVRGGTGKALAAMFFLLAPVGAVAEAAPVRILAFGDSLTAGYGLAEEEGFVAQLNAWIVARGVVVQIVNAGVSGDTTSGGAARIDWALSPDVQAMVLELGANDMLRGIDPAVARANLDAILSAADKAGVKVLLVGIPVPGNFGEDYKAAFEAIYPDLARAHAVALFESFFKGLGDDPAAALAFMQADGIHPNGAGVTRIVDAIGPSVLDLVAQVRGGGG